MTRTTEVTLDERWGIGGKLHGGYLLRELVAPLLTDDHPHPMAVSAHFVHSPDAGPAAIETETLRQGRRVSQHRSRMTQGGRICVEALVTSGSLDPAAEPFWTDHPAPELTPMDQCVKIRAESPRAGMRIGHWDFVDGLADPQTMGFTIGKPSGTARLAAYVKMPDRDTRAEDLLVLGDAMPPVTMDLGVAGWVPTLELTVLIRAVPAPGWLRAVQTGRLLEDGWLDEQCDIWDSRGRLVCQARQLAGYRLPES